MKRFLPFSLSAAFLALLMLSAILATNSPRAGFAAISAPTPLGPASGGQLPKMTTTLTWQMLASATQYHLQVIPALNDGPGINVIRSKAAEFTIPPPPDWYGLLPGMSYSWRLRATDKSTFAPEDDPTWSPWSEAWTFRTPATSSAGIAGVAPVDGSSVAAEPTVLRWSHSDPAIFYFEVQVSGDATFNTSPGAPSFVWSNLVHGGVATPQNSWMTPPLERGGQYYWRVRPRVQGDGTPLPWSPAFAFRATYGPSAPVVEVIDGDTIDVQTDAGTQRVRLIGVDTPEVYGGAECFGAEASAFTKSLVPLGLPVSLEKDVSETDRYQRLLRYVWLPDGRMLNETLVAEGFATVATYPPDVKYQARFLSAERSAREMGKGLWSACPLGSPSPTPSPEPSPAPSPTPTPAGEANVEILFIFADGLVPRVESDEYVGIVNEGPGDQDMSGWRLNAGDRGQDFYFPAGFILAEGQSCRIYTNQLHPEHCNGRAMSFGRGSAIWANAGDCGHLFNARGEEVSRRCY